MAERNSLGQFVKGSGIKDLTGKRFGKLVVLGLDKVKGKRTYWICKCDCGNEKSIRGDCLNRIQSCGCVKKQQDIKNLHITNQHGMTHHRCFHIWCNMMQRCYNPKSQAYRHYGARGIGVCDEWKDPKIFCDWMDANGFVDGLSIERTNVNGNYEPSNCILIPLSEQVHNRRCTIYAYLENGERKPLAKVARDRGISIYTALQRWERGVREEKYLFHLGNLQKDYPELFGGFLK